MSANNAQAATEMLLYLFISRNRSSLSAARLIHCELTISHFVYYYNHWHNHASSFTYFDGTFTELRRNIYYLLIAWHATWLKQLSLHCLILSDTFLFLMAFRLLILQLINYFALAIFHFSFGEAAHGGGVALFYRGDFAFGQNGARARAAGQRPIKWNVVNSKPAAQSTNCV